MWPNLALVNLTIKANIYSNGLRLLVTSWCTALSVRTVLAVQRWRTGIVD